MLERFNFGKESPAMLDGRAIGGLKHDLLFGIETMHDAVKDAVDRESSRKKPEELSDEDLKYFKILSHIMERLEDLHRDVNLDVMDEFIGTYYERFNILCALANLYWL